VAQRGIHSDFIQPVEDRRCRPQRPMANGVHLSRDLREIPTAVM
jgi:hypothetical protein